MRGQRPAVERIRRPGWTYIENGFFHRRVVVVLGRAVRLGTAIAVTGTARVRAGRAEQTRRKSGIPRGRRLTQQGRQTEIHIVGLTVVVTVAVAIVVIVVAVRIVLRLVLLLMVLITRIHAHLLLLLWLVHRVDVVAVVLAIVAIVVVTASATAANIVHARKTQRIVTVVLRLLLLLMLLLLHWLGLWNRRRGHRQEVITVVQPNQRDTGQGLLSIVGVPGRGGQRALVRVGRRVLQWRVFWH